MCKMRTQQSEDLTKEEVFFSEEGSEHESDKEFIDDTNVGSGDEAAYELISKHKKVLFGSKLCLENGVLKHSQKLELSEE